MSVSKMIMGQAANQYVAPTYVEDVFSTYLYNGTGSAQTITNGIDLSGEGGLVWIKRRDGVDGAGLFDTVRGATKGNFPSSTSAELTDVNSLTSFNSNGFTLGTGYTNFAVNGNNMEHVAWTWRKAPKFFDVVTYTGNSTAGRTISHNLGSVPGMMIVKRTSSARDWVVYHRGNTAAPETDVLYLNLADATTDLGSAWYDTAPTSTEFTLGDQIGVNANGETYVAYLFAHNDGDGDFGLTNDQDIIKCGSYTTDASADATINLGFEPQWVMFRPYDDTSDWKIIDNMRGFVATPTSGNYNKQIAANSSGAEADNDNIKITSTGFEHVSGFASKNFIYMAIRRPMATTTSATDVFGVDYAYTYDVDGNTGGSSAQLVGYIGKPADLNIQGYRSGSSFNAAVYDRLRNNRYLITNTTSAEASVSGNFWDNMAGFREVASGQDTTMISWTWRRAPGFFDVVAYTGNGTAGRTVSHNLGVAPEMIWVKRRNTVASWPVYHSALGNSKYITLNDTGAASSSGTAFWNSTSPTATEFTVDGNTRANGSGDTYIAYLFATVAGVSKVGSYTGNDGSTNVDCGFSNGARFVMIKKTNGSGDWFIFDSTRGIVAGNDPSLKLNTTEAEDDLGARDIIDPLSSGFTVNANRGGVNDNGDTFIFYAIAA